jgi:hypothetical protein
MMKEAQNATTPIDEISMVPVINSREYFFVLFVFSYTW